MAFAAQSSRFAAILLAVADRLRTQLQIDSSRVVVVKRGGYAITSLAESHYRVRSVGGVYFGDAGAGRYGTWAQRTVAVDVFTRSAVDVTGEDEFALTEEANGQFDAEEAAADALLLWTPLSAESEPLTIEPLHPIRADDADAPDPERYSGYLVSTLYFEVKYVAKLTLPELS